MTSQKDREMSIIDIILLVINGGIWLTGMVYIAWIVIRDKKNES